MSTYRRLYVHQSDGVVFGDLLALNREIETQYGLSEVFEDRVDTTDPRWVGFIRQDANGGVEIATIDEESWYGGYNGVSEDEDDDAPGCMVWGCWSDTDAKRIANHMIAGKLVFRIETEGRQDKFNVLTSGRAESKSLKQAACF